MSHSTLVIPNVDAVELEKQRLALGSLDLSSLNQVQQDAVCGICKMLDYWSDKRHKLYTVVLDYPHRVNLSAKSPYIETLEANSIDNAVRLAKSHAVESVNLRDITSSDFVLVTAVRGTVARK